MCDDFRPVPYAIEPRERPGLHYPVTIHGYQIEFHIYVNMPGSRQKVAQLIPFLTRMPRQHLAILYPIFIMRRKPHGGQGGGTWTPGEARSAFTRTHAERNTGIPDSEIQRLVVTPGRGMIGMSEDRWQRPMGRLEFTLLHEVAHCVHCCFQPGGLLPPGATESDFPGMETNRCGHGSLLVRRAVEAYARYICRPARIFHTLPSGSGPARTNERLIRSLRSSPAFRSVPTEWSPA